MGNTKIEFFDDENSIYEEDEFSATTWDFIPEIKRIKRTFSINEDIFYGHDLIEYRISGSPLKVEHRLLESYTEPPIKYRVKDGVVLESEMLKGTGFRLKEELERLKEQVEWNELEVRSLYHLLFFILSIHPEIISNDEYRRFLRQTEERIKLGLTKVRDYIDEKDQTGLVIVISDYGRNIWYREAEEMDDARLKRASEYVETFEKSLFNKQSPHYSGITKNEFIISEDLLEHIGSLLNKKESSKINTERGQVKHRSNLWKWGIVIILSIIALTWGVWTAIGIFILGSIIIGIMSR